MTRKIRVSVGRIACAVALVALVLPLAASPSPAAGDLGVKFHLKADENDPHVVDVTLSFKLNGGESVVLKPPEQSNVEAGAAGTIDVELPLQQNPEYIIEALEPSGSGWKVTANIATEVSVSYIVRYSRMKSLHSALEAPGAPYAPRAIAEEDLKAFRGSDLLICPRRPDDGSLLAEEYAVEIELGESDKALTPWTSQEDSGGSFEVDGSTSLLENLVCWGRIDVRTLRGGKPDIVAGFSNDYGKLTDEQKDRYGSNFVSLYDEMAGKLGARPELTRLTVLFTGAGRFGLNEPASRGFLDSVGVFHGGSKLEEVAAAAAARGLFELWNRWSFVPAPGGDAGWFQQGLPWFYPYRCAGLAGLLDADLAFEEFSRVHAAYLTNPLAPSTSLVEAEHQGGSAGFLASKGAVLCAGIAQRLFDESRGEKDIDWLLGRITGEFDHFEGKEYELVDISELCEEGTGNSWDRFFEERVRGEELMGASEFSSTGLFGTTSSVTGSNVLEDKGSGKSWIYLAVAVVIILMIPVIFSAYVKRSIKLDLQMPTILPDDEDDDG